MSTAPSIWRRLLLIFLAASSALTSSTAFAAGGELRLGRYLGFIKLDDTGEKIALVVNTFIVQPANFTEFPKLNATFKMSLGGYGTPEYVTETFEDIRYDFNNGILSLDEPANELVISAEVNSTPPNTQVTGQIWIRSAAESGTLYLEYETDEPGADSDGDDGSGGAFVPALRGQYEGRCGADRAAIQVMTGKGLVGDVPDARGLHGYGVKAILALDDRLACGDGSISGRPAWCVTRVYPSGSYNFFANTLNLDSPSGSSGCSLLGGRLQCQVRMLDRTLDCDLQHTDMTPKAYAVFGRDFSVRTTADQRAALPEPAPPQHADLVQALRGQFTGYLHNEATDRYQAFKLNVIPSVSTINPHDENRVFVSSTAVAYFGRRLSGEFWSQQLNKTPFYIRPGFTLESDETDGFLQIEDWRKGYIKAVWFSHAYGRVGTVQLVKDPALPALDASANLVESIAGEFRGPRVGASDLFWSFSTIFPTQPTGREQSAFVFEGDSWLSGGIIRPVRVDRATYDPYTGSLAWVTEEEEPRMILGNVNDAGEVFLFWPGASKWGVRMAEYGFHQFQRVP